MKKLPTFTGQGLQPEVNLDDSATLLELMESADLRRDSPDNIAESSLRAAESFRSALTTSERARERVQGSAEAPERHESAQKRSRELSGRRAEASKN